MFWLHNFSLVPGWRINTRLMWTFYVATHDGHVSDGDPAVYKAWYPPHKKIFNQSPGRPEWTVVSDGCEDFYCLWVVGRMLQPTIHPSISLYRSCDSLLMVLCASHHVVSSPSCHWHHWCWHHLHDDEPDSGIVSCARYLKSSLINISEKLNLKNQSQFQTYPEDVMTVHSPVNLYSHHVHLLIQKVTVILSLKCLLSWNDYKVFLFCMCGITEVYISRGIGNDSLNFTWDYSVKTNTFIPSFHHLSIQHTRN